MLLMLLMVLLLSGCGAAAFTDHAATLQAEVDGYVAEATAIQEAARADATRIMSTVVAAQTQVVHQRGVNAALYATVQAALPPTQQLVDRVPAGTPQAITQGQRWFVKTGMTPTVRASDGCAESHQSDFSSTTARIYATFKAYNIQAGTRLGVIWAHNGQSVFEEAFTLERSANEICLWFYIEPSVVEFTPGLWSAQLFADGFRLESAMPFTIVG